MEDGICGALAPDGPDTILTIEVTAGHGADSFPTGYNPWRKAVGCRVAAPPVGGRANRAVIELIAAALSLQVSRITIVSGQSSSLKRLRLSKITVGQTCDLLQDLSV